MTVLALLVALALTGMMFYFVWKGLSDDQHLVRWTVYWVLAYLGTTAVWTWFVFEAGIGV